KLLKRFFVPECQWSTFVDGIALATGQRQSYSSECDAFASRNGNSRHRLFRAECSLQDPFYHKEKRRKKARMLDADAWLDSAMFEFWQSLGRGYTEVQDFLSLFHVAGTQRYFVVLASDGLSFAALGAVLMTADRKMDRLAK